jgi:Grx4 family monothiol glutaredoxin
MLIDSVEKYEGFLIANFERPKVLVFLSDSIDSSKSFEALLKINLGQFESAGIAVGLVKDEFEGCMDIFSTFEVEMVPTSVVLNANFSVIEKAQGISPGELLTKAQKHSKTFQQSLELESLKYKQTLNRVLNDSIFIIFDFLKERNADYPTARKYLEDHTLPVRRQSTAPFKEDRLPVILAHLGRFFHNDYAYYVTHKVPLAYFHKVLVDNFGDLERVVGEKGEVIASIRKIEEKNVESILENNKVILFVNSDDSNYQEQQQVIDRLQKKKVMFTYLDVATKPAVLGVLKRILGRESLELAVLVVEGKQVIEHSELVKSMAIEFEGLVRKEFIVESVDDRIRLILESAPVVLFIKGTPEFPQCGFTRQAVELMRNHNVKFGYYNILADAELRERLRSYSGWETYPQIYVNKELVGGLDICRDLIENGDFQETFKPGLS